jgi:hypothetical protein
VRQYIIILIKCWCFCKGGQLGVGRKWSKDSIVMNVRVETIDNFRAVHHLTDEITFLKVDAEGKDVQSECDKGLYLLLKMFLFLVICLVLKGADKTFTDKKVLAGYFECSSETPLREGIDFLSSRGYDVYVFHNDRKLSRIDGDYLKDGEFNCNVHNILFIKHESSCAKNALCSYTSGLVPCQCFE